MGFKMASHEVKGTAGGSMQTASQFIPLSAELRGDSLFVYGMESNNPYDSDPSGRTYEVAVYGTGDAVGPDFEKGDFVSYVEIEDRESRLKQRLHGFCRRRSWGP